MVKIVGRDEQAVKRITCRKCASILEYTLNEVKSKTYSDYGGSERHHWIDCPQCKYELTVRGN